MKDYEPFEIILSALLRQGYSEDEALSIIIDVIEEQKWMDDIAVNIHKLVEEELNNPKNWS